MADFFEFEADFVESLRCIPMQVRFKLDTCGIKLKLHQWNCFNEDDRRQLVDRSCDNPVETQSYREFLQALILSRSAEVASELSIDPSPPWLNALTIPDSVLEKAESFGEAVSLVQWSNLQPLQRFALIKLSRSNHENANFRPALVEFGITG
jgi:hypothetical protein